jgi:hypothetical protein
MQKDGLVKTGGNADLISKKISPCLLSTSRPSCTCASTHTCIDTGLVTERGTWHGMVTGCHDGWWFHWAEAVELQRQWPQHGNFLTSHGHASQIQSNPVESVLNNLIPLVNRSKLKGANQQAAGISLLEREIPAACWDLRDSFVRFPPLTGHMRRAQRWPVKRGRTVVAIVEACGPQAVVQLAARSCRESQPLHAWLHQRISALLARSWKPGHWTSRLEHDHKHPRSTCSIVLKYQVIKMAAVSRVPTTRVSPAVRPLAARPRAVVAKAAASGTVPDVNKRNLLNLMLAGATALPVTGLAVPFLAFFVPPRCVDCVPVSYC